MKITGKMSCFGGPHDTGVRPNEGLALLSRHDLTDPAFSGLFLAEQPEGTTGLARRLNPAALYIAMRWNYRVHPPSFLRHTKVTVSANGKSVEVQPVDWGPNEDTDRVADLGQGVLDALGLKTDDIVTVDIPDPEDSEQCSCSSC